MRMRYTYFAEEINVRSRRSIQWPSNAGEARQLTRQQFRWLTEGLSIDQPRAIQASEKKKDF